MAWRVLAASKSIGADPESLVGPAVRTVHPLVAALLIGGGGAIALVVRAVLLRFRPPRRPVDPFAAGISGAGVGAAAVFLRTHGLGGLPTLALAAAAAGFLAKRGGGSGRRQREIAPRRRTPQRTAASATASRKTATSVDASFAASARFVSPPPLPLGQVSHYAPPRTPINRYVAPSADVAGGGSMLSYGGSYATPGSSSGGIVSPPRSPERQAAAAAGAAPAVALSASIAASPLLTTPVRGSATATESGPLATAATVEATGDATEFVAGWSQLPGQKNEDTVTVFRSAAMQYVARQIDAHSFSSHHIQFTFLAFSSHDIKFTTCQCARLKCAANFESVCNSVCNAFGYTLAGTLEYLTVRKPSPFSMVLAFVIEPVLANHHFSLHQTSTMYSCAVFRV
eukprot:COSAG06_NODE_745_length_12649_cov_128.650916_1_plen_399_part_00